MILDGGAAGELLTRDKILVDATSGNTGIAYAMIWRRAEVSGEVGSSEECIGRAQANIAGLWG